MRRVLAAALFAFLLLPAAADAADRKPPKIVKAAMQDSDQDGRADGVLVTFSEKVRHAKDTKKPFPFTVVGYTVKIVGKAKGKTILVTVAEHLAPDGAAHPVIRYKRTKSKPVRDRGGNQAKRGRFRNTIPFDAAPPETTISTGPSGPVTSRNASFTFSSEASAVFECALDAADFSPCSSGLGFSSLADGSHIFAVRAIDLAGNPDPSPATRTWTVDGDGDGSLAPADCAPDDAAIHPGALDVPEPTFTDKNCDGIDGDKAEAIFVSPSGTNAAGCGTFAAPCLAVQIGLARAIAQSKRDVYLAAGTYAGPVSLANDVDVFGGFSATWVRSAATTGANQSVTITGGFDGPTGHFLAVKAVSLAAPTTLADVRVLGPDAAGAGASSYGVVVQGSAAITLTRVIVEAGDGVDGSTGTNGTSASQTAALVGGTGGDGIETSDPDVRQYDQRRRRTRKRDRVRIRPGAHRRAGPEEAAARETPSVSPASASSSATATRRRARPESTQPCPRRASSEPEAPPGRRTQVAAAAAAEPRASSVLPATSPTGRAVEAGSAASSRARSGSRRRAPRAPSAWTAPAAAEEEAAAAATTGSTPPGRRRRRRRGRREGSGRREAAEAAAELRSRSSRRPRASR